jgi:hypothetical protein
MAPRLPHKVTVRNPGTPTTSPVTGNEVAGEPVSVRTRAYLSQRPVENLSSAIEVGGEQTTVIGVYTLIVPPGVPLRADSVIEDSAGALYEVEGSPALRQRSPYPGGVKPYYQAAALRRISDLQGA